MTALGPHALACLLFTALVFVVFVWDRLPIASVSLFVLAVLPLGFALFPMALGDAVLDPMRFFAGFGNPALVAICALMVVGHGLVVTGAMEPVARRLSVAVARHPKAALLGVLVMAGAISGVVNDTPVVVLLIPLLLAAARQAKVSAAGLLMPMNFAVLIGGMATTIGTSTNLIVVSIAASMGVGPFSLFGHFDLVALAAVPALLYLWLLAPRLLARVQMPQEHLSDDVFDAELNVAPGSWLDGRQLRDALEASENRFQPIDLRRGSRALARLPSVVLRAGDRVVVRDTAQRLKELESLLKAPLHALSPATEADAGAGDVKPDKALPTAVVAQLVVTSTSPLVGRSVRQERLAERYGFVVVGLRPRRQANQWQRGDLADRSIDAGDVLLLQGRFDSFRTAQRDGFGLLLDERFTLPRQHKAPLAMLVMGAVVLLAATKLLPISLAAVVGAAALVLSRCLSWQDVTNALSTKVVLLVVASLALGDALQVTGATSWLAQGLADAAADWPAAWVAAGLMALMGLVTNFVSNNAAAAIGTPLAIALAKALGLPAEPFVLAVLFGANLCYLTPMAYQTNLLVMNAGGYRFGDFMRVGAPLFLILWVALSVLLAWRYGLAGGPFG